MRRFKDDETGQLILIACVSVAAALVLIATYEYSTLGTGENSINRETMNSYYFYDSIKDRYSPIYNNITYKNSIDVYENDIKKFALLHGYSVDFVCSNDRHKTIIFIDKDIKIEEKMGEVSCP
ncbi:MAG: hypothetical protein OIN88_05810 [Candidatus Methanoperedens sp.]|nr:hypothetical protein [Candidatus Methanoperedens sp.]